MADAAQGEDDVWWGITPAVHMPVETACGGTVTLTFWRLPGKDCEFALDFVNTATTKKVWRQLACTAQPHKHQTDNRERVRGGQRIRITRSGSGFSEEHEFWRFVSRFATAIRALDWDLLSSPAMPLHKGRLAGGSHPPFS